MISAVRGATDRSAHSFGISATTSLLSAPASPGSPIPSRTSRRCRRRSPGRSAEAGLSREGVQWATRTVALVADRFPAAEAAGRLKSALFGGATAPEPHPAGFSEAEVLLALAITKGSAAFDARVLGLRDRATRLLETNAATAGRVMQAALEVGLNPIGEMSLGALLSGTAGPMVATAVARNLRLAESPGIWAASPESRQAIWKAVRKVDPPDDATRARVMYAILEAGCDDLGVRRYRVLRGRGGPSGACLAGRG